MDSLADKIISAAKPARTFSLDVRNISSLNAQDVADLRQLLVEDLTVLGFSLTRKLPADAQLQLTLSESADNYVWVTEIHRGDTRGVAIVSAARDVMKISSVEGTSLTLQQTLVWGQDSRILDFGLVADAVKEGASILVVLEPDKIEFYENRIVAWQLDRTITIPRDRPLQRDVQGRIDLRAGKAQLPYANCTGDFQRPDTVICTKASRDQNIPPLTQPVVLQGRSVDSYAVLESACGISSLVLVSGQGDWTETDFVQAFGLKNQTDVMSEKVQFPGPILALWASDDGKSARVVSRNLQTGAYEASIVSVSCND